MQYRQQRSINQDSVDRVFNIEYVKDGPERLGYLTNFKTSTITDQDTIERTVFLAYFVEQNGNWFKSVICFEPYFYISCKPEHMKDMAFYLEQKFEKKISNIQIVEKTDLEMPNHLSGKLSKFLKLSFRTITELMNVRNTIKSQYEKNIRQKNQTYSLSEVILSSKEDKVKDMLELVTDIREYDVPYHSRVCIDLDIRAALWYRISFKDGCIDQQKIIKVEDKKDRPDLKILAFDIETSKQPLKFPDANFDCIIMISLMYEGDAYLITNRQICGQDVEGFEYAPKPEYECRVFVYNEPTEKLLLDRFFTIIEDYKPLIITSYNGDQFDWPFIEKRALQHGLSIEQRIALYHEEDNQYYYGRFITHLDCFHWVERDAYLPQGSHGLKAVTRAKLGYDPIEVDPELMVPLARQSTQQLAEYSISDAVATYFLYKKHIHDFIYALCTIIPMFSDEVLRKGSGTLCEHLLMAEAFKRSIIFQNKKKEETDNFTPEGHLLDNETYVGGKVECLRSGVYRSDIPTRFTLDPSAYDTLIQHLDSLIEFFASVEQGRHACDIANYEEVFQNLADRLTKLRDVPQPYAHDALPIIYHLDVAAMYPNIILTNRLQPVAIVNQNVCGDCLFGANPENDCRRVLEWQWHGEYYPLSRHEYYQIKQSLSTEFLARQANQINKNNNNQTGGGGGGRQSGNFYNSNKYRNNNNNSSGNNFNNNNNNIFNESNSTQQKGNNPNSGNQMIKSFEDQPQELQKQQIKQRVKLYCQKTYKRVHDQETTLKTNTVCMRENSFYIDTVRMFRDRRYLFKGLTKKYKDEADDLKKKGQNEKAQEAKDLSALYESLQLAHKIILNSFYGYVMRKGARWYSMEMAAMVTHIGSSIISDAKNFVDKVGKPLELDTDGIWCLLPFGFPEHVAVVFKDGKKAKLEYPCSILNQIIYEKYCNRQYQTLNSIQQEQQHHHTVPTYKKTTEMSIFFEIDGPYKAMVIPAAREEGKLLKKRYVVFNHQNKIQELKGFELKRRGELKIIKIFQSEIFDQFLKGTTLEQCYQACGEVAAKWMDLLNKLGEGLEDEELIEYIGEQKVLSKELREYGEQKGVGITAAKRLGEFLGNEIVRGKGLNCNFVISKKPIGAPVAERSIPVSIFNSEEAVKRKYLRKWLKEQQADEAALDLRAILDWDYYKERLGNTILKIIIIPASLQGVKNILPEIPRPDWLNKAIREQDDKFQQRKLMQFFQIKNTSSSSTAQLFKPAGEQQQQQTEIICTKSPFKAKESGGVQEQKKKQIMAEEGTIKEQQQQQINNQVPLDRKQLETPQKSSNINKQIQKKKNPYDMETQFKNWLKEQKDIWREERLWKKEERGKGMMSAEKNKLKSMIHLKEEAILKATWEILQITPDLNQRGVYKIWFYTQESRQIHSVCVNIPRVIYVNNLKEQQSTNYKLVKKRLPREKTSHYLYEIALPEEEFIAKYDNFDYYLSNPLVEGVYEEELPLDFKFILQLGNTVKLLQKKSSNSSLGKGQNASNNNNNSKGQNLTQISHQSNNTVGIHQQQQQQSLAQTFQFENVCGIFEGQQRGYLHDIDLQYIYIAQIKTGQNSSKNSNHINGNGKQHQQQLQDVWCIFNVPQHEFMIFLVHKNSDSRKYASTVKEALHQGNAEQYFPELKISDLKIQTINLTQNAYALHSIEQYLSKSRDSFRGQPPLIVFQTHYSLANLKANGIRSIHDKYPALILSLQSMPCMREQQQYSALDWIVKGIRGLCSACCQLPMEIANLRALCDYAKIPLCNVFEDANRAVEGGDHINFITDVVFCRILRQMNCVAWYNQFTRTNNNNRHSNDYRLLIASDYLPSEIVKPGMYNTFCVELDIVLLALNTIAQSDELKNLDQEVFQLIEVRKNNTNNTAINNNNKKQQQSANEEDNNDNNSKSPFKTNKNNNNNTQMQSQQQPTNKKQQQMQDIQNQPIELDQEIVDEVTVAKTAFKCVKIMVKGWLDDVMLHNLNQSDTCLQNIHRWIVSEESKFHDPYLSRMLSKLMRKVYGILVNALQQRQAQIVYASMSKIIINTGKHTFYEAKNYIQFLLQHSIMSLPLFQNIAFNIITYYNTLLFKDIFNYTAIKPILNQDNTQIIKEGIDYTHNWHISQFLPAKIKHLFDQLVIDYVYRTYQIKSKLIQGGQQQQQNQQDNLTDMVEEKHQEQVIQPQEVIEEQLPIECQKYIRDKLADRLYDSLPILEKEFRNHLIEVEKWNKHNQFNLEKKFSNLGINNNPNSTIDNNKMQQEHQKSNEKSSKQKNSEEQDDYSDYPEDQDEYEEDDYEDEEEDSFVVHDDDNESDIIDEAYDQLSEDEMGQTSKKKANKKLKKKGQQIEERSKQWEYPHKLGRASDPGNCITELINYVMHAIGLDQNVKDEVRIVKKNCCALLKISEFESASQYQEPSLILKLQDFVCKDCFNVQEIDIFRDNWSCSQCGKAYDLFYVQNKIIQFVNNNVVGYQIQDLYCQKCKIVKDDFMQKSCQCAGQYYLQIDAISNPLFYKYEYLIKNLSLLAQLFRFNLLTHALEIATH